MVKLIGVLGILLGSGGIGMFYCQKLKNRVEALLMIQKGIRLLESEIRYRRVPLAESFRMLGKQLDGEVQQFFFVMAERIGKSDKELLAGLWETEGGRILANCGMKPAEIRQFQKFGASLGMERKDRQLEALQLYAEYLKQQIEEARSSYESNHRLCLCLGWIGGLFLTILVI